jgi:L-ascorbate metabolism protein UlaG (beta-lactamase superfamily)
MRLRLLRHATLVIEYAGRRLLVDPMLSEVAAMDPVQNSPNPRRNPLVPLPVPVTEVVRDLDAVLVTHTHRDHWDTAAAEMIPKDRPLFGQPEDHDKFVSQGFTNVTSVQPAASWNGISITRTGGQHGTGEIGRRMAPVSGFVLRAADEPTLYIAGDTIWCDEVRNALGEHRPDVTVLNAGAARFLEGDPITMSATDVITVCRAAPFTRVVADHMDAFNHCLLTRDDLRFQLEAERVLEQVRIPADGEVVD